MPELRSSQLHSALQALGALGEVEDLAEFPLRMAQEVRGCIPCHHAGYTAVELGTDRVTIVADPQETVFKGGPEVFARFAHQNPLLSELAVSGASRAGLLSDYLTQRELHRTELYDNVYRHIPLEYQLGVSLQAPGRRLGHPTEVVGLSLVRIERDFTASERLLVELIRPHLSSLLGRLHELALLRATEAADHAGDGRWTMLIDDEGAVAWASAAARADLDLQPGTPLPAALLGWTAAQLDRPRPPGGPPAGAGWGSPLCVEGMNLQPRLVPGAYPGLHALHLRALAPRPTIAGLRALGLTRRQAEVMQLALCGRSSPAIATALRLSPRTVEKHMEASYRRLGAGSRTEAVLIAARALDP